ncbi:MAG: single-stranded DNA-binding protein [Spirochaetales bacterium]|nr:single-stranded DNA-binding protein [Spirochaetales bacterium]
MNNLNSVIIEGNLTRDPEQVTTPKGTPVCKFTIATNRYFKSGEQQQQQQEVSFFAVETWAKLAGSCSTYLEKGRGVRVVGRLKQERWVSADEKKHERVVLVAEHVEFKPQSNRNIKKDEISIAEKSNEGEAVIFAAEESAGVNGKLKVKPVKESKK